MRNVILVLIVFSLCTLLGCEDVQDDTTHTYYRMKFFDSTIIENLRQTTGSESITGALNVYTGYDSLDRTLLKVTFVHPQKYDEFSANFPTIQKFAESIIKSMGVFDHFDSLELIFSSKPSLLKTEMAYTFNVEFIQRVRDTVFLEEKVWFERLAALIAKYELQQVHTFIDSLSAFQKYKDIVLVNKISLMMIENREDLSIPKSILLKELEKRPLNMVFIDRLGRLSDEQKQYDTAAKCYDILLRRYPNNIDLLYSRAYIYTENNDLVSAKKLFQSIKNKGSSEADAELEELRKIGY